MWSLIWSAIIINLLYYQTADGLPANIFITFNSGTQVFPAATDYLVDINEHEPIVDQVFEILERPQISRTIMQEAPIIGNNRALYEKDHIDFIFDYAINGNAETRGEWIWDSQRGTNRITINSFLNAFPQHSKAEPIRFRVQVDMKLHFLKILNAFPENFDTLPSHEILHVVNKEDSKAVQKRPGVPVYFSTAFWDSYETEFARSRSMFEIHIDPEKPIIPQIKRFTKIAEFNDRASRLDSKWKDPKWKKKFITLFLEHEHGIFKSDPYDYNGHKSITINEFAQTAKHSITDKKNSKAIRAICFRVEIDLKYTGHNPLYSPKSEERNLSIFPACLTVFIVVLFVIFSTYIIVFH